MPVMEYESHEDFVSGLTFDETNFELISVAGDCTLCVYDIRMKDVRARSDEQECELTCVEKIKDGRKVICGSQDGVVLVFTHGKWGDCSDRFCQCVFPVLAFNVFYS